MTCKINRATIKGKILHTTRRKKDTIFGAQSIQKQLGIQARKTRDFDIFTQNSKKSAIEMDKLLDKATRGNNFYIKKGIHKSTWKVKSIGQDCIKGTRDDKTVVDYSKFPPKRPKVFRINGINYRRISEELAAKRRAVKDPRFAFRRAKDKDDIKRILKAGKATRKGVRG